MHGQVSKEFWKLTFKKYVEQKRSYLSKILPKVYNRNDNFPLSKKLNFTSAEQEFQKSNGILFYNFGKINNLNQSLPFAICVKSYYIY